MCRFSQYNSCFFYKCEASRNTQGNRTQVKQEESQGKSHTSRRNLKHSNIPKTKLNVTEQSRTSTIMLMCKCTCAFSQYIHPEIACRVCMFTRSRGQSTKAIDNKPMSAKSNPKWWEMKWGGDQKGLIVVTSKHAIIKCCRDLFLSVQLLFLSTIVKLMGNQGKSHTSESRRNPRGNRTRVGET